MKKKYRYIFGALVVAGLFLQYNCEKDKENIRERNTLSISPDTLIFDSIGGTKSLSIKTDAEKWSIEEPAAEWISLSRTSGSKDIINLNISVITKTVVPRSDTITVSAGNATPVNIVVSQISSKYLYALSANVTSITLNNYGDESSFSINTDAPSWNITSDADWLTLSQDTGSSGVTIVKISALQNDSSKVRLGLLTITADHAPIIEIPVTQSGEPIPSYNTNPIAPDTSGMSSDAAELASKIILGWNLGNSLEALGGETGWGNPVATKDFIDLVKANGFNAVRLPCSWNQYANISTAEIKTEWLNRVKEVIQYCVDNDMYVLLNIHWDGGWLENNCTLDKKEINNKKQKAFWEQIATHLRDFDEHLMFASANEPNVDNNTEMAVLRSYHQTFIDAVRSTGGKNTYRVLVVQGPSTDIEKTLSLMNLMPIDPTENRLMVEVHYYTPWNFCGLEQDENWGKMFYYWGTDYHSATDTERNASWGEESMVDDLFSSMKKNFVDYGYPVILGEYSAMRRSNLTGTALTEHLASRAFYHYYVTKQAKANGLIPFYWDNGGTGVNGSGLFNRNTNAVYDQQTIDALTQGATE